MNLVRENQNLVRENQYVYTDRFTWNATAKQHVRINAADCENTMGKLTFINRLLCLNLKASISLRLLANSIFLSGGPVRGLFSSLTILWEVNNNHIAAYRQENQQHRVENKQKRKQDQTTAKSTNIPRYYGTDTSML